MLVPREQLKVAIGGVVKDRTHYILRLLSILSLYPEALLEELFTFFFIYFVSAYVKKWLSCRVPPDLLQTKMSALKSLFESCFITLT